MGARIAVFIPSLNGGGAERVALFLVEVLAADGYAVDLVVACNKGALVDHPTARTHRVDLAAPAELLSALQYRGYLKRAKPDLVIALVHSAKFTAALVGLFDDTPLIVSVHNSLRTPRARQWWVRRWFGLGLERRLYRRVRFVHAVCHEMKREIVELLAVPPEKVIVVYNPLLARQDGSVRLKIDDDPLLELPVIVTAGRLVRQKDQAMLIRAFARGPAAAGARLLILGEGPELKPLQRLARELAVSEQVLFRGYVRDIRPFVARASAFVLTSQHEGFGLVLVEALALGASVISVDCPCGPREVLGEGRFGRLIAPGDEVALADAMTEAVNSRRQVVEPGALADHLRLFSPEQIGEEYRAMIRAVIGAPAATPSADVRARG